MKVRLTGTLLGVNPIQIEQSIFGNPGDICSASLEVLKAWFKSRHDGHNKWIELYAALRESIGELKTYDLGREFQEESQPKEQHTHQQTRHFTNIRRLGSRIRKVFKK